MTDIAFIAELETLIRDRLREAPENSYTASLAAKGILAVAQKVGEEGVELALAAAAQDRGAVIEESADLLFHMLVLLALKDIPLARVVAALAERHQARAAR